MVHQGNSNWNLPCLHQKLYNLCGNWLLPLPRGSQIEMVANRQIVTFTHAALQFRNSGKDKRGGSYLQLHSESFQELCVHGIVIDRAGSPSTRTYCDSSCGFDGCIRVRRRDDFPYAFAIGYLIGWRYANLRNL